MNIFGVKTGAIIQNIFTAAKVSALLGLVLLGLFVGRNAQALAANFQRQFLAQRRLGAQHAVQVGVGGPMVLVGTLTILAVAQVGSLFSADAWNNVTFTAGEVKNPEPQSAAFAGAGNGRRDRSLHRLQLYLSECAAARSASPTGATILERGIKYATEDRVATAVMTQMFGAGGRTLMAVAIMISSFRLQQRPDSRRRARVLRDGQGRTVLPQRRETASQPTRRRRFR